MQETKASAGYHINEDKFEVRINGKDQLGVDLIKIYILDKFVDVASPTSENRSTTIYGILLIISAFMLLQLLITYKKKNSKNYLGK